MYQSLSASETDESRSNALHLPTPICRSRSATKNSACARNWNFISALNGSTPRAVRQQWPFATGLVLRGSRCWSFICPGAASRNPGAFSIRHNRKMIHLYRRIVRRKRSFRSQKKKARIAPGAGTGAKTAVGAIAQPRELARWRRQIPPTAR